MKVIFGFLLVAALCYAPLNSHAGWTYCYTETPHAGSPGNWTAILKCSWIPISGGSSEVKYRVKIAEVNMGTLTYRWSDWTITAAGSDIILGMITLGEGVVGYELMTKVTDLSGAEFWVPISVSHCDD